jgi:hypothetical protein
MATAGTATQSHGPLQVGHFNHLNGSLREARSGERAGTRRRVRRVSSLRSHNASGQRHGVLSRWAISRSKPNESDVGNRYHQAIAEGLTAGGQSTGDPGTLA